MVSESESKPGKRGSWTKWPRLLALTGAILFGLLIPVLRFATFEVDHGMANAFTGLLGFFAIGSLILWFLLNPRWSWLAKIGVAAIPFACVLTLINRYEFLGFSGEMIPQFRVKGSLAATADRAAEKLRDAASETTGDLQARSPQFLGLQRDGRTLHAPLAKSWSDVTPKIQWKIPVGAGWAGMSVDKSRVLTLEQIEGEEWVTCYDLGSGKLLWKHADEGKHFEVMGGLGPRSTPTIDGDRVYTLGATGIVNCLDLLTGNLIWTKSLLTLGDSKREEFEEKVKWGRAASPLIVGEAVILPCGSVKEINRSLIALDRKTGETLWVEGKDQISYVSPTQVKLLDQEFLASVNENTVTLHQLQDGKQVWSYPWPGQSNGPASCTQPIALDNKNLFLSKGYGGGAAYLEFSRDAKGELQSKEIWKSASVLRTKFSNPIFYDGHIYGLSDGVLECVRVEDGKRQWKGGRYGHGQMLLVGNQLVISSEDGDLVLVDATPAKWVENAKMHVLDGITWNIPTFANGWFLMRNGTEMACLKLPQD